MKRAAWCGLMLATLLTAVARAQTPAWTRVTLEELDCAGCAKKVARHVGAVPGVAEVRYDLKTRSLYVGHKPNETPSPRALWEAVEKADHKVERLDTPTASHTSKPAT